jgi:hypothetical protein
MGAVPLKMPQSFFDRVIISGTRYLIALTNVKRLEVLHQVPPYTIAFYNIFYIFLKMGQIYPIKYH